MLKDTLLKFFKLDGLANNFTGYVETRIELLKIEIREEIAKGLSKVVLLVVLIFMLVLFVFFVSMAVAYKLSEYIGFFGGFGVIAGLYFVVSLILFLMRESLGNRIEKHILEITKKRK